RGFAVRLLTDDGNAVPGEGAGGFAGSTQESADSAGLMLDTLAVVGHSDGGGLSRAHDVLRGGNEGLLIAFFGDLDEEQAAVAARMRQRAGAGVAFVLDSAAWAGEEDEAGRADERLRRLRESGWIAVPVEPGAELPALWRLAGGMRTDSPSAPSGGTTGFTGGWS
ncbi:DUF58 domain-containing protein, partial [Streptomyces sp. SID7499]|nr:DUF58 domain-containing protein [Streptomyces sp. SID7499]